MMTVSELHLITLLQTDHRHLWRLAVD